MPDAASSPPTVDLDAYADVVGRTWGAGKEALGRELAERSVSPAEWEGARAFWTEAIDEDLARGGTALVLTFATRFEASRAAAPERPAELRDDAVEREPGSAVAESPAPVRQAVPSYLQLQAGPVAPAGTAELDLQKLRELAAAGPTPFAGKTSPERLQTLRATSTDEEARFQELASGRDEADETVMYQPSSKERAELQTLPFETGRGQVVFPEMDVDQYAAFAAQLEAKGPSSDVLERHGVTSPKTLLALHTEQERRLATDPALRARFEERKAHFMGFMKGGRT